MCVYSCHKVDPSNVQVVVDAEAACSRYVVELGHTKADLPPDTHVAGLCLRMYSSICTISSICIYLYASGDDFEQNARGAEMEEEEVAEWPVLSPPEVCDTSQWRLHVTRMSHVAVTIVQEFAHFPEAVSFGSTRASFSFETMERATLALAVDRVHNYGSPKDILSLLCYSLDFPCLSNVF